MRLANYSTLDSHKIASMEIRTTDVYLKGSFIGSVSGSVVSDRDKKNSITDVSEKYDTLFDGLIPRLYKYNDGTSGRTHVGMIAQEVKSSMDEANISSLEFAAYIETTELDGSTVCGLRYEEFISLNIWQIQKLKQRVAELEQIVSRLQNKE